MTPELTALFREVADLSPAEREQYYVQHQVPDAMRAEVESLLRYDGVTDSLQGYVASAKRSLLDTAASGELRVPPAVRGIPAAIGRFTVLRLLGRGGMGDVYLARDPVIDRLVAIKMIGGGAEDEPGRRRLVREARAAGRLHHPNIVTVFEAGEHDGLSYIAMEYVPGETLGSIIRRRAPLTLRQRLEMIEGACAGLAHAHRAGVVHLDIKPDNLMLAETGLVKVLDFGISRLLQSDTRTLHGAGTLRYMSPEQIQGKALDHRSDVFSIGCALFELVSYTPAFSGSTKEIVTQIAAGPAPSLLDLAPRLDHRLDDIVARAMAVEPSGRYDDLDQLRAELAAARARIDPAQDEADATLLGVAAPDGERPTTGSTSRRRWRRWTARRTRWKLSAAVAALVVATVAAAFAWANRGAPAAIQRASAPIPATASRQPSPPPPAAKVEAVQPPVSDEVWRRLARGDRPGVLERLAPGAPDASLASAIADSVRASVLRGREDAASSGSGTSSETYRAAEQQLARANRLSAAGQSIESLRALWAAADLYARSPASALAPTPSIDTRPAPRQELPAGSKPVPLQPPPQVATLPQPPPPLAQPQPQQPQPSPAANGAPADASTPRQEIATAPPPPHAVTDAEAIAETLRRYDAAYEMRDVAALLKVLPSLDKEQIDQLRRTFDDLSAYEMTTQVIRVTVAKDTATAAARVARRMVPRVGRPVVNEVDTEFRLRRSGSEWVIVSVTAR
jgi:serine/threonine-protein kinase